MGMESEAPETVTPYLCVTGAAEALAWYASAFGAVETVRLDEPDGRVGHAELRVGNSTIMLADEFPEINVLSPTTLGGSPVIIQLYVPNVDEVVNRAVTQGARLIFPVSDQFYGDRSGRIEDPFGHLWIVSTHIEDVSNEEMGRRMAAWSEEQSSAG